MRRRWLVIGILLASVAAGALGYTWWDWQRRWYRAELELANRDITGGRFSLAKKRLQALSHQFPGQGEVELPLGLCEQALGRPELALEAWKRVPTSSPFAGRAAVSEARLVLLGHRFAEAERLLLRAVDEDGPHALEARQTLAHIYKIQGRIRETRRLLRADWARVPNPVAVLREFWRLDRFPFPVQEFRETLEKAAAAAPDDDRIELAWGHLATRAGNLTDAAQRLDKCLEHRPDDPAVWATRLDWARAAGRLDEVERSLPHLPASYFEPVERWSLRAWMAAQRGDAGAEQQALKSLVDLDPLASGGIERLIELELAAGRAAAAAALRRRRADLNDAITRYDALLFSEDPVASAGELARLAARLGRTFDSRCWWNLAFTRDPRDEQARAELARLPATPPTSQDRGRTLADLVADLRPSQASASPRSDVEVVPQFVDDAVTAGLQFTYENGRTDALTPPVMMGGGVGLLDFDGDGWLDVYCVQGGPFPPNSAHPNGGDRLFRNRGNGTFEDVSTSSGITELSRGYGYGVAVGDFDADGRPDLFVTRWRSYALYRNLGGGRFQDVTTVAGLGGDRDWPTSAAFADLDGDGDLDLYVCHYLVYDPANPRVDGSASAVHNPLDYEPLPDHLFRNDGGKFVDITNEAGIIDRRGRGLGVLAADLDADGKTDLFVANDMTANYLFKNLGNWKFAEIGHEAGLACNANGGYQAGMGIAAGDLDGDGLLDLAVTNFYGESTTFFHNLGGGQFSDRTAAVGLALPSRFRLGFGAAFLDANNDGLPDLVTANGHVNDLRPLIPYAMPAQLLIGAKSGGLRDATATAGQPFQVERVGRGLAMGDLDNDGQVDLLVESQNSPLAYFHNRTRHGHFLTLLLEGGRSGSTAVGAIVTVRAGTRRWVAQVVGGGSYASANDPRIHFGLGEALRVDLLEVRWPSGRVDTYRKIQVDSGLRLREGETTHRPLPGFSR